MSLEAFPMCHHVDALITCSTKEGSSPWIKFSLVSIEDMHNQVMAVGLVTAFLGNILSVPE